MIRKVLWFVVVVLSVASMVNAGVIGVGSVSATASSTADGDAMGVVNGAGRYIGPAAGTNYDPTGQYHDCLSGAGTWLSSFRGVTDSAFSGTALGKEWLVVTFDQVYSMDEMKVWNYNYYGNPGRGIKDVYIDYSADGTSWTRLMDGSNDYWTFNVAPGAWQYLANTTVDFGGVSAKYVVLTTMALPDGQWSTQDGYYGLSELEFSEIPEPATLVLLGLGGLLLGRKKA